MHLEYYLNTDFLKKFPHFDNRSSMTPSIWTMGEENVPYFCWDALKALLCLSVYLNEQFIFTELFIIKTFLTSFDFRCMQDKSINYGSRFHGNHETIPFYVQGQIFELIERLTTSQTYKQTLSITRHQHH